MRVQLLPALIVALLSSASAMAAGPTVLGFTNNHNVEPLLVKVNAEGKVTDIVPAYRLTPELTRLLRDNLNEMIHTPAHDKDGKPVPSQFLMNVALQVDQRSTGDYDAHFVYVSATPLPDGRWYWSRDSIGQLALASPNILSTYPGSQPPPGFASGAVFSAVNTTSGSGGHSGGGHGH
jgi:hypothetical protein